ncbi:alpha/beta fold hydrolase [Kitasatospora sp. HPMI-4]|uniref:alpha/beta fold hydrolase n=1 Tax=Kitasatospora sp. HPMI-4 TaxID=3448443 RepID=UPI003F19E7C7
MRRPVMNQRPRLATAFDRSRALTAMERISAVTHLVSSLEYLAKESDREAGGLNNWAVTRRAVKVKSPLLGRVLDVVGRPGTTRALHATRVAAAASLWLPLPRRARAVADTVLVGTELALHPRQIFGSDGADQLSFLVQSLAAVARAGERRPRLVDACLWAVALQSVMSYTVSGLAKLPSLTWRSGDALPGVTRTLTYGDRRVWQFLNGHPRVNRALAHAVLALETGFPAVFLRGGRPAPLMVASVGAFHLVNARVMGLGRFFWAFCSTYPAVLYATGPKVRAAPDGRVERRSDALPVAFAALAAAGFAAAQAARARGRRTVDRGLGGERLMTTTAGSTLSYRRTGGAARAADPVLVLESGLGTSPAHWAWLAGELGGRWETVSYQRAGYGPSRPADGAGFSSAGAAADLADLALHAAGDRPIVLVGHSVGGYLALLAAERLGERVQAVVLLDTSHPAELQRSPNQALGARQLSDVLALLPESLRAGFGPLLERPDWLPQLPEQERTFALAHYRDTRTWATARREWQAVRQEFTHFDGRMPRTDAPLLVLTAGRTAAKLPEHADLHRELAESAALSELHLIHEADHDGILTGRQTSREAAGLVTAFLDRLSHGGGTHRTEATTHARIS